MTEREQTAPNAVSDRSWETIEQHHLRRLAQIATDDLEDFFQRYPDHGGRYRDRLMLICLCQGAAGHFIHRDRGVSDFDVWAFFRAHPERPFPYRRPAKGDFGPSRFGRHPDDAYRRGRGVDLFGRSIPCENGQDPHDCVRAWLASGGASPRKIAKSAVVVIHPEEEIGSIIWDPGSAR